MDHAPPLVPPAPLVYSGKVRDTYDLGDRLLMVASDRFRPSTSSCRRRFPAKELC